MKKIFLIILLLSAVSFSPAQSFYGGITMGVSGSQIDGDEQSGYNKAGLLAGVFVGRDLAPNIALNIEMYYVGKGALMNTKYPDGTVSQEFKTHLNYIEMPVLAEWKVHEKFSVSGGLASAFLISSKLYYLQSLIPETQYSMKDFDFSPMAKVDFHFSERLNINLRFSYSVLTIRNDFGWYNNNLSIAARYRLGR